jgi:hypothetical protein
VWLSEADKKDLFDLWNKWLSGLALSLNTIFSKSQNGKLRWYLVSFAIGIAIILTYMLTQ